MLGRRRPLLGDFDVPPPEDVRDDGQLRLRDLIEHVVRAQVAAYHNRQEHGRFDRVLTATAIEDAASHGKVASAGKAPQYADVEEAIAAALEAFEDGLYLVVIDDVERRSLDEPVYLSPDSRLMFVRLTFLSGA